jgi:DNA polymerase III subunit gamma/tau
MDDSSDIFAAPDADEPGLGMDLLVMAAPVAATPYRVLARKYRPQTFAQLIGQDAMVQTLANAIKRDRLAHAFLMTGVRGVGKTSTARLIAKALNCIGADGQGGPTIETCGVCEPCVAIAEGRHIDVIEMDAASNRGIDSVRELTEAVRYAAVSARYKIYIIDEVHMMTKEAFNALLKTLEEPPPHVKFLFATTEADKLPITVLSRCQRFDLRRVDAALLATHFARICAAEGVGAEPEALALIAEAAEGSVRDGLSILDQAIAHADLGDAGGEVRAEQLRDMLGLADKGAQRRLFAAILAGDGAGLLELVRQQYAYGVEPVALMRSAMELTHRITVTKLGQGRSDAISQDEREAVEEWAERLTAGQLHRLWQLFLKGFEEVQTAPDPLIAAEMALLRCLHAADLPDPDKMMKRLEELAASGVGVAGAGASASGGAAGHAPVIAHAGDWAVLVARAKERAPLAGSVMESRVRVVAIEPELLRFALVPGFSGDPSADIIKGLFEATGAKWRLELVGAGGEPSLHEQAEAARVAAQDAVRHSPLVAAALAAFPGAEILDDAAGQDHGKSEWRDRA